jgi:hypothetical protein
MADMQFGGWYNNPAQGGSNMRYWGDYGWTTGSDPTQGGGGGGQDNSVDSILNSAISSITQYVNKPQRYDEVNPFSFDETLAREAATKEFAPYYQEMLTDYVSNAERTKSRSQEDYTRLLTNLGAGKEYYMGTQRRVLDKALRSTDEGYAGRGLFFSGAREKDVKEIKSVYGEQTGEYMRQYGYNTDSAQLGLNRDLQDVNTGQAQYTRDNERLQKAAIEGGVLTRRGEAMDEYNIARDKYYENAIFG